MSNNEAFRKKLVDLQERFQQTIDHYYETEDYFDFIENNDADYVEGYIQAQADLGRVYLKPGEEAPKGRQIITTKRGRRYYKTAPAASQRMPGNPFHSGGIPEPHGPGAKSKEVKEAGKDAVKHSTTGNAFKQEANRQKLEKKQEQDAGDARNEEDKKKWLESTNKRVRSGNPFNAANKKIGKKAANQS